MKRLSITIWMLMGFFLSTTAQKGLCINDVFEGKVVLKSQMKESLIKGDNLASYNLRVLHTAKFTTHNINRELVEKLFCEDMKNRPSDDDENMEMESRNGHLYYAIVQLTDSEKGAHRFICYQCKNNKAHYDITLVYMEGQASLADLRNTFKKK